MAEGAAEAPQAGGEEFVGRGVCLAAPADWVDLPPLTIPAEPDSRFVIAGISVLLEDVQTNILGAQPERFYRRAELVAAASGASHAARFQVEFNPVCERVDIHYVRIHRQGQILKRGDAKDFDVLRRERNLEMRQFDGRLTVHLEIPDVRAGDVVETAWTIRGGYEILAGRHSEIGQFEWSPAGMVETRRRLLADAARPIAFKTLGGVIDAPSETRNGDVIEWRWIVQGREGARTEPLALPWAHQLSVLQASDWRDWGEVAARFVSVYEDLGPALPELDAKIAELALLPTPAERAAAALRFVQNSVRYLAISMGEGGLVPRSIAEIWETRYGDCKDVTKLYVYIARRLGLDVCPALVNDPVGEGIAALLPTPGAFNHCLIRLRIDGAVYWLDATMAPQPSPLATLFQPRLGWALPIAEGVTALEHMGEEPYLTLSEITEDVALPDRKSVPVSYTKTSLWRGWRAEAVRAALSHEGEAGFMKTQQERLQQVWHGAKLLEHKIADNTALNEIELVQKYEISDAWKDAADGDWTFTTLDTVIAGAFAPLPDGPVKHPIYLGRIGRSLRRVNVEAARAEGGNDWDTTAIDDAASVNFSFRRFSAKRYRLEQEFKIRKIAMHPESADRYRELEHALRATDVNFVARTRSDKFTKTEQIGGGVPWFWLIWLVVVIIAAISRMAS